MLIVLWVFLALVNVQVLSTVSFLANDLVRKDQVQTVLEHRPVKHPDCHVSPTGPIETTMCDYEAIESINEYLYSNLRELVRTPFFRYFQVDLYRECPFWQENLYCMNRECGITTVDESEIPEKWRAAALSKIEQPSLTQRTQLPGCYYRDSDFCFLDDLTEGGDYIDLSLVPERYTGYEGPSTHRVWSSIYEENCFGESELGLMTGKSPALVSLVDSMTEVLREDAVESTDQCLEKRVYYKIISGLHASISTHICHDYLNQNSREWVPNLQCFVNRVASHPERLQYIYFNTVLLLRAVARIGPYLSAYDYCSTGTRDDDAVTLEKLKNVIDVAQKVGKFDESVLFRGENANVGPVLKEEFKTHFRNVSRIMDCVGCDKCRLWGKVQTTGIATALKILFELDEKTLDPHSNANLLQRSEVVALINTLHRFSESLEAVNDFREMWAVTSPSESATLVREAENTTIVRPRPSSRVGMKRHKGMFEEAQMRLAFWSTACRKSAIECIGALLKACSNCLKSLGSIFEPSGKDQGPTEYGEL